jgi:hypothetical protein
MIFPHSSSCGFHLSRHVRHAVVIVSRVRIMGIAEVREKFLPHLVDREIVMLYKRNDDWSICILFLYVIRMKNKEWPRTSVLIQGPYFLWYTLHLRMLMKSFVMKHIIKCVNRIFCSHNLVEVYYYQTTWHNIPGDGTVHGHCLGISKSCIMVLLYVR